MFCRWTDEQRGFDASDLGTETETITLTLSERPAVEDEGGRDSAYGVSRANAVADVGSARARGANNSGELEYAGDAAAPDAGACMSERGYMPPPPVAATAATTSAAARTGASADPSHQQYV